MANSHQVISLYRSLLKESKKFPSYNFRNYALRRIRDSFRENKTVTNSEHVGNLIKEGHKSLELIKRQVVIGEMYSTDKLVIENIHKKATS